MLALPPRVILRTAIYRRAGLLLCQLRCVAYCGRSKTVPDPGVDEAVTHCAEQPRQLPILVTTVDIGEDQSDQIELYEGDSPEVSTASLKWRALRDLALLVPAVDGSSPVSPV
jgi:hypothetical protein